MYPTLKKLVDDMGFADFYSINAINSDNRLIHALVERWWPSTHTFHFPCGELGFTPLDFVMLTGIYFGRGRELLYDEKYSKLEEAEKMFPGITSSDMRYGNVTLSYLKKWQEPLNSSNHNYDSEMDIVYARAFIAYMMGNLFFSNGVTSIRSGYLAALIDYDILGTSGFDWGSSIMAALYRGLDEVSVLRLGKVKKLITGFYARYDRMEGHNQHRLATMGQVYEIKTSRGKRCKSTEFSEGSIGVSPYGHGTLRYLGDRYMRQMTGLDSVPYDPPQEIMEFLRYDRELYQSLKDVNYYDGRDYLVPGVDDYMTYWRLVHLNPKIGCTIVKRMGNIWYRA
ncbi:hypothetical protein GIB67_034246 [Kingdonia uniflora]|uniref:Aminotransferase-like plant mobile domain-containing protein n=1 Tax=Kingdonia uniflora TaxID=39325 RepID=A0A7J7NSA4_9MAGN|nr:hypothetical protein GIB67_034246 [Kingdonia uniflora]